MSVADQQVYGTGYSDEYDELYRDKDYVGECDLIVEAIRRAGVAVRSIADFGCGTGGHSIVLAQRGYDVTGVDRSGEMLQVARRKAERAGVCARFVEGDIRGVSAGGPFDAGLFMFAVLGYLVPNEDVRRALRMARQHVRTGGLLLFDVWYGPAVLNLKPSDRVKIIPRSDGRVIRTVSSSLDSRHHTCEVRYHLWRLRGDQVAGETEETHLVRYFFPMELELFLTDAGFALSSLTAFPTADRPVADDTWNVFAVARAV